MAKQGLEISPSLILNSKVVYSVLMLLRLSTQLGNPTQKTKVLHACSH